MDNLDRRAKFDDIKSDEVAVQFHADQFAAGYRYLLARQCWFYLNAQKTPKP